MNPQDPVDTPQPPAATPTPAPDVNAPVNSYDSAAAPSPLSSYVPQEPTAPVYAPVAQGAPAAVSTPESAPSADTAATPAFAQQPPVETPATPTSAPAAPFPSQQAPAPSPQPVNPFAPAGAPVAPVAPVVSPAFGTGPVEIAPSYNQPAPRRRGRGVLIAILIAALLVVGGGIWALFTFLPSSIPLEAYEGDGYSISVPKGFEKEEFLTVVSFKEPDVEDAKQSAVSVTKLANATFESAGSSIDSLKKSYEDMTADKISDTAFEGSNNVIRNFKNEALTHQGSDARQVSYDVYRDSAKVGSVTALVVFAKDDVYIVTVNAHVDNNGLEKSASAILKSLKIN